MELKFPYQWRTTVGGGRKHAVDTVQEHVAAVCGVNVWTFARWRGTGSQAEYDKVDALPPCKSCCKKIGVQPT